jgi:hypothetical protein
MVLPDRAQKGSIVAVRLRPVKHVTSIKRIWGATRSLWHNRDDAIGYREARIPIVPRRQHEAMGEALRQSRWRGDPTPASQAVPLSDHGSGGR